MANIAFITSPDARFGFGLAGIAQYVAEQHDAEDVLKQVLSDTDTRLVVIDERLANDVGEARLSSMERGWSGILLVLPSPGAAPPEAEDYLSRLIRKAIGYHVRLTQ